MTESTSLAYYMYMAPRVVSKGWSRGLLVVYWKSRWPEYFFVEG
jgi:hypothetical protein